MDIRGRKMMKKIISIVFLCSVVCLLTACGSSKEAANEDNKDETTEKVNAIKMSEDFELIKGGSFTMGSPESEPWRGKDETPHEVEVNDFYIGRYEVTQKEYEGTLGKNPSNFKGDKLPVENITWLEAVTYCNARSEAEDLTPAYTIKGENVTWNQGANGYRLPTEAEWEYACRGETDTPFNTKTSISTDEANYWGDYPYEIEDNYFSQENLDTQPGEYRETTVDVDEFTPNTFHLFNMHGNVGEWVWDYYGDYDTEKKDNPVGPAKGTRKVIRGGGWNDFAKNLRSAYRAAAPANSKSAAVGFRMVRNAVENKESVVSSDNEQKKTSGNQKTLIGYFSWGGNTKGIAEEIQGQIDADVFEIELETPYSDDYNTVLDQAQADQKKQARPKIKGRVDDINQYDTIILGYPNWWASIPMPIASFLEDYDMSGKTIVPFCSHGGGRFGQSITAISKLAPDATIGEGIAVSYSGDSGLSDDIAKWLKENGVEK